MNRNASARFNNNFKYSIDRNKPKGDLILYYTSTRFGHDFFNIHLRAK